VFSFTDIKAINGSPVAWELAFVSPEWNVVGPAGSLTLSKFDVTFSAVGATGINQKDADKGQGDEYFSLEMKNFD